MKTLFFLIAALVAYVTPSLAQADSLLTESRDAGQIIQNGRELIITGALAKSLYFQLDKKLEIVSYIADCNANVPGCASRVGEHLYCSNGDIGDTSMNYKCYADFDSIGLGQLHAHEAPPWVK